MACSMLGARAPFGDLMRSIASCLLLMCVALDLSAADYPTAAEAHVHKAREIAGDDLKFLADGVVCKPAETQVPWAMQNIPGFLDPNAPGVKPFAAFDNLYYVGQYAIGTWILDTGDGLILFDSLNSDEDVKNILLPGMRELGLDPHDLKYLIITHGHFDHYGGSNYLNQEFGVPIMMPAAEWEAIADDIALPYAVLKGYPKITQPTRKPGQDDVAEDGQVLALGDATVQFVVTPGHTAGTLSSIIKVKDNGEDKYVAMWGGQALHADVALLTDMHESLHKFWHLAKEQGAEGAISTHAWVVGNFEMQAEGRLDGSNPMLIGTDGFDRVMSIYDQCIHAQFARSNAKQP